MEKNMNCLVKKDIVYYDNEGQKRIVKAGRTLSVFKQLGDRIILRLGNKMFITKSDEIELI